jgi:hypothetical protein
MLCKAFSKDYQKLKLKPPRNIQIQSRFEATFGDIQLFELFDLDKPPTPFVELLTYQDSTQF